jgi:hypothetical protein
MTWSGTGAWGYSNPAAFPECLFSEVPAPEGFEEPYYECENPTPSGRVPTEAEARVEAAKIFQATGLPVSAEDVRVLTIDEWGVGVSAALVVDGVETALEWSLYFAPGPILASATIEHIGTNTGTQRTVKVKENDEAVDFIRRGM